MFDELTDEPASVPASPDNAFNAIRAERNELDILIDRGMYFTVPMRSLLKYFSKTKERTLIIRAPFVHTQDRLSREFIDMDFSEEALQANPLGESKRLVAKNALRFARIVAIAILNRRWKINLLGPLLAHYLADRITSAKLLQIVLIINQISNTGDFINSIRLTFASRTTIPALMEKKPESLPD